MNPIKYLWRRNASLFDWVQQACNGDFWRVFHEKFGHLLTGSVLDLACGTGALARAINPKRYLGIDRNGHYLAFARSHTLPPAITFRKGNILADLPSEPFDTICLISILHHLSGDELVVLFKKLRQQPMRQMLIVETLPKGPLRGLLLLLDAKLGDGEHFRTREEIQSVVRRFFSIQQVGAFEAKGSLYSYQFLVATRS